MRILVTGGAGYIGSHAILELGRQGHEILTYDNLSTGNDWAVLHGDLVEGDLGNAELLRKTIKDFSPEAVLHFAASIVVSESMKNPLLYYRNNVVNTINLMKAVTRAKVPYFIYSSTAAVYGVPETSPVSEEAPMAPINPYGRSKMMAEQIVRDACGQAGTQFVILRYFNVAGADPQGRLGQVSNNATHLIARSLKAATGELGVLPVYGADYQTPDGTCVRDYIHVSDLAAAHTAALAYMTSATPSGIRRHVMNCGYGRGYSVHEVVAAAKKVTGVNFKTEIKSRRPGDPPSLISDSSRIRKITGWKPQYDDLDLMIRTAWEWEKKRADREFGLKLVDRLGPVDDADRRQTQAPEQLTVG
ncbi:MAG TPA: UDP-glucose 4-epimerase GalE [Smithellaceae bacterium]|nr:UDP-glucose 4-epimerase GalE [Smithellaceae bacterium]